MKTITFNYTKKDGSTSERTLLVVTEPKTVAYWAGIDLSEISPEDGSEFAARYEELHQKYLNDVKELQAEFDLKHSYRQFLESGMSDVIEI
jgi:hypothetical protein